jgi:Leucine-rich repeat (LRR) protein
MIGSNVSVALSKEYVSPDERSFFKNLTPEEKEVSLSNAYPFLPRKDQLAHRLVSKEFQQLTQPFLQNALLKHIQDISKALKEVDLEVPEEFLKRKENESDQDYGKRFIESYKEFISSIPNWKSYLIPNANNVGKTAKAIYDTHLVTFFRDKFQGDGKNQPAWKKQIQGKNDCEWACSLKTWLNKNPHSFDEVAFIEFSLLFNHNLPFFPCKFVLANFPNLRILTINFHEFSSIPDEIELLSNLEKLDLNSGKIHKISEKITKLSKLKFLRLSWNKLKCIPKELWELNLEELSLSENEISILNAENIKNSSSLKELDLSKNKLSGIPNTFAKFTKLKKLNLEKNELSSIPGDVKKFLSLQNLDLFHNKIIQTCLPEDDWLQIASLNLLQKTRHYYEEIFPFNIDFSSLKKLDSEKFFNFFKKSHEKIISGLLSVPKWKEIYLKRSPWLLSIAQSIKMHDFSCIIKKIKPDGGASDKIADYLENTVDLSRDMKDLLIDDHYWYSFGEKLFFNVTEINLQDCGIATFPRKVLTIFPNIKKLNLIGNPIQVLPKEVLEIKDLKLDRDKKYVFSE